MNASQKKGYHSWVLGLTGKNPISVGTRCNPGGMN